MVQRIGGFRRKTRNKLKKPLRQRGKLSLRRFFQEFKDGEKVLLAAEPAYQKGMYMPRFHGKSGIVTGRRGDCYDVKISDNNKQKLLTVHPVHLRRA